MKAIFFILIVVILASCSPEKEEIAQRFIDEIESKEYVSYSTTFTLIDESKGAIPIAGECMFKIVPDDTIAGVHYNIKTSNSNDVYNGPEFFQYEPGSFGDSVVKLLKIENDPDEFFGQEIEINGQIYFAPSRVKASFFYSYSIIELKNEFKDHLKEKEFRKIADTVIEGRDCYRLFFTLMDTVVNDEHRLWTHTYAFDKESGIMIYHYSYYPVQQSETIFRDISFEKLDYDEIFTANAYPKYCKVIERAPDIEKKSLKIGQEAPDWKHTSINGNEVSLSGLKGTPLFLVFSEIGCAPCMEAIPDLNELANEFPQVRFVGIYPLDSKKALLKMAKSKEIVYDILHESKKTADKYYISGYPTFFIIDKEGQINFVWAGYGSGMKDELKEAIKKVL